MSNSIARIQGDNATVTITPSPIGTTQSVNDNTAGTLTSVATTAYVNSLSLAGYISLTTANTISASLTFTGNIISSLIYGFTGILSFAPTNLSIGKSGGTTTFLGTNPFVTNFPYWVSSGSLHNRFFGVITSTISNSTFNYPTANVFSTGAIAVASPTASGTAQTQATGVASFRPIYSAGAGPVNVIIAGY